MACWHVTLPWASQLQRRQHWHRARRFGRRHLHTRSIHKVTKTVRRHRDRIPHSTHRRSRTHRPGSKTRPRFRVRLGFFATQIGLACTFFSKQICLRNPLSPREKQTIVSHRRLRPHLQHKKTRAFAFENSVEPSKNRHFFLSKPISLVMTRCVGNLHTHALHLTKCACTTDSSKTLPLVS